MKNKFLLILLLLTAVAHAQPRLVTTIKYHGPKEGGGIFRADLPAATPGMIHTFDNFAPHMPLVGVCAGDNAWLYGNINFTGTGHTGACYRIKRDGTGFEIISSLDEPAKLIPYYHTDGNIYFSNTFQLRKFNPVTHTVTSVPVASGMIVKNLLIDADDWVYYFSYTLGLSKIKTDGSQETLLHTFINAIEGNDGSIGVTETPGDTLFGVQKYGGALDGGTLYSVKKDGSGFIIHHQFTAATGIYPESKLTYFDGKLYGTTTQGGNFGYGVLYTINADGSGYRVIRHFDPGSYGVPNPAGNISISSNGRIFGSFGQFYVSNTNSYRLFKIDTSGNNFEPFFPINQREGGHGNLDILLADDETIFVPTAEMGRHDGGALNQCDTAGVGSGLYHWGYSANGFRSTDGLIKATDGKLYGTTSIGGITGNGTVFSVNENGTGYTKLHEFSDAEGYEPGGKLLEAGDGKLYGACKQGGPTGTGCIYRMDKNGSNFQIVYNFQTFSNGYSPVGSLAEDNAGVLYGATFYSSPGFSVIFKMNRNGSNYTVLKLFDNAEIHYPYNGVTLSGGYLYGSCGYGGTENKGGVFRIKTDGTGYQLLRDFTGATDGVQAMSTPIVATNGKLYGSTVNGGSNGFGTIYSMDVTGSNYAIIKNFTDAADGSYPEAGLIQGSDGLLYGTTLFSSPGGGNIFKMNLNGTGFSVVKTLDLSLEGQAANTLLDLNGNAPLPVQWLTFNATPVNKTVVLKWQTAQEQNSREFEIERSSDGNAFNKIGMVAAAGNSALTKDYSFTDSKPFKGTNYYRLRQTDLDGKFTYSKVITINFTGYGIITFYPNPVRDVLNINTNSSEPISTIIITDINGRLVQQVKPALSGFVSVSVKNLPAGIYWIQVKTTQHVYTQKITRQ